MKIGGIDELNQLVQTIERYDLLTGVWDNVDPAIEETDINSFNIYYASGCASLNLNELFIFGGCNEKGENSNLTFTLSFDNTDVTIRNIMKHPLPYHINFADIQSVYLDHKIFFKNPLSKYSLISFDGHDWIEVG